MKVIQCIILFFVSEALLAQDSMSTVAKPTIKVNDHSGIYSLMERHKLLNDRNVFSPGFRIQIAFTNNKEEAMNYKKEFYQRFPNLRCYTTYEQPYHKVRIGDYQNLNETKRDLSTILEFFPGAFVVADKVRIRKMNTE
ncbi:MAG: SPOR domain-containing protein [Bacteroidetes bacterium]|nr:SPOR domain-containing protein [Bacteroidota bacterium]